MYAFVKLNGTPPTPLLLAQKIYRDEEDLRINFKSEDEKLHRVFHDPSVDEVNLKNHDGIEITIKKNTLEARPVIKYEQ